MTKSSHSPRGRAPLVHIGHPESHIPMFDPPDVPSKPLPRKAIVILFVVAAAVAIGGWQLEHFAHNAATPDVALPWALPFGLLLACIATMPFIARHFWEHNFQWVSIGLGGLVVAYYAFALGRTGQQQQAGKFAEYISFIFLLGSLFIVSGGILIHVRRTATPTVNATLLLLGAILANVFGTTGASMLLIRPFLRINKGHIRPFHVVFFIFIVSNLGGALTPIGDPPLFLGYLKGVPFWWVAEFCWQPWAVGVGSLVAIFFVIDTLANRKGARTRHDPDDTGPAISIFGAGNLVFIALVLGAVFMQPPYRELLMAFAACGSLWTTPHRIHKENVFNFAPIREVALLFVGIFATMTPALNYLSNHAQDPALERYLHTPGQFYFASGSLSSVLDNAPTYLTFLETELGKIDKNLRKVATDIVKDPNKAAPDQSDFDKLLVLNAAKYPQGAADPAFKEDKQILTAALVDGLQKYHRDEVLSGTLTQGEIDLGFLLGEKKLNWYIVAISLGSVFFGAMTYIGNGPNFMVKSIAENAGVKCPSFFGYIFRYALPILLPVLLLVWLIFLLPHAGH